MQKETGSSKIIKRHFVRLLNAIMQVGKREPSVERLVLFVTLCCSARGEDAETANVSNDVLEAILDHLLDSVNAKDKAARMRAAQMISNILSVIPADGEFLQDELWDKLETRMFARLDDKVAGVRAQAVRALERLQDSKDCASGQDPIFNKLTALLEADSSAEVRKAAIKAVVITKSSLKAVLQRTRDAKDDVRAAAYERLGLHVHIKMLSISQRVTLLTDGLNDRSPAVRQACEVMFCEKWLASVSGNPFDLLKFLDVENSLDTVLRALHLLFDIGLSKSRSAELSTTVRNAVDWDLSGDNAKLVMTPEGVVYLRAKCEALIRHDREDDVEALIPDLTSLGEVMSICQSQLTESSAKSAEELDRLSRARFVLQQLMEIAKILNATHDIAGQHALTQFITKLLDMRQGPDLAVVQASLQLLRSFVGDREEEQFVRQGTSIIFDCLEPLEASNAGESDEPVVNIAQLQTQLENAVASEDYETAAKLKKQISQAEQSPQVVEGWRMERALVITVGMLQAVRRPGLIAELQGLMDRVIVPNLQERENDHLRHLALKSLALYCQLGPKLAQQNLPILLMFLTAEEETMDIRADALRGILDLIMLWGMSAIADPESEAGASTEKTDELMLNLLTYMDSDDPTLRLVTAEGFAKLAVVGRLVDVRVLQCLIVIYFHSSSAEHVRLRQCLAVCFPILAESTRSGRSAIEDMAVPILENLVTPPPDSPFGELPAESVLQYIIFLLSHSSSEVQTSFTKALLIELLAAPTGSNIRLLSRALNAVKLDKSCDLLLLSRITAELESTDTFTDSVAFRQFEKFNAHLASLQSNDSRKSSSKKSANASVENQEEEEKAHVAEEAFSSRDVDAELEDILKEVKKRAAAHEDGKLNAPEDARATRPRRKLKRNANAKLKSDSADEEEEDEDDLSVASESE